MKMSSSRTTVKIFNTPQQLSSNFVKANSIFVSRLEELVSAYEFLKGGGIEKLCIFLVFNKELNAQNQIIYENGITLIFHQYPAASVSSQQDIKHSCFRAGLDALIKECNLLKLDEVKSFTIILFFNQSIEDINISGLDKRKNEEGLLSFSSIEPRYHLEQIVLNEKLLSEIKNSLLILSKREIIYKEWGFEEIDPAPRAILNFFGPSGTGKTMTAHAISHSLSSKILALNYAEIESKFVGDAPKNLIRAFETASRENSVLFFDEADSFLGKRISNVTSSSDQAVNSLRSQMLILLENFDGVIIFATNLIANYDRAFESRIFKHLKFDLPDFETRKKIILKTIPPRVPLENNLTLSDDVLSKLSNLSESFSGREIKNAVLDSLICALSMERSYLQLTDLYQSFRNLQDRKADLQEVNSEKTKLDPSKKSLLERKIAKELSKDFSSVIIKIAAHAAFSDGILDDHEKEIIEKMAKDFDAIFELPSSVDDIEPLNELLKSVDNKNKQIEVIQIISHIISANKTYSEDERIFVSMICSNFNLGTHTKTKIDKYIRKLSEAQTFIDDLKLNL